MMDTAPLGTMTMTEPGEQTKDFFEKQCMALSDPSAYPFCPKSWLPPLAHTMASHLEQWPVLSALALQLCLPHLKLNSRPHTCCLSALLPYGSLTTDLLAPLPLHQVPQSTYQEPKEQQLLQMIKRYNRRNAEVAMWGPCFPKHPIGL